MEEATKIFNNYYSNFDSSLDGVSRKYDHTFRVVEYAEKIAKEDGALYLQLTCSYSRESAQRLYEKAGYEKRESNVFRKELS